MEPFEYVMMIGSFAIMLLVLVMMRLFYEHPDGSNIPGFVMLILLIASGIPYIGPGVTILTAICLIIAIYDDGYYVPKKHDSAFFRFFTGQPKK